jgi:hypothetical protein
VSELITRTSVFLPEVFPHPNDITKGPLTSHSILRYIELSSASQIRFSVVGYTECEPVSSVSIVSDYGTDDRATEVRSPPEAKGFLL